jgi:hypothetical protein
MHIDGAGVPRIDGRQRLFSLCPASLLPIIRSGSPRPLIRWPGLQHLVLFARRTGPLTAIIAATSSGIQSRRSRKLRQFRRVCMKERQPDAVQHNRARSDECR